MGEEGLAQMLLNGVRLFDGLVRSSGNNLSLSSFLRKRRSDEWNSLTPLQKNIFINQRAAQNEQNTNNVGITNQDLIDYMNSEAVKAKYAQMLQERATNNQNKVVNNVPVENFIPNKALRQVAQNMSNEEKGIYLANLLNNKQGV